MALRWCGMRWYYVRDGRQEGPVDALELRRLLESGAVKPSDLVWNESMGGEWVAASTVAELNDVRSAAGTGGSEVPPPLRTGAGARRAMQAGVSCTGAVEPAWARMVAMLFRPFSMGKWFALGFSAWLATWFQSSGSWSPSLDLSGLSDLEDVEPGFWGGVGESIEPARAWVAAHVGTLVLGAILLVLLGFVLGLLVLWVRARGKFMFLDNVVHDRSEVSGLWRRHVKVGNSLFLWTLGYSVVLGLVSLLMLMLLVLVAVVPCVRAGVFLPVVLLAAIPLILVWMLLGLAAWYVSRFLEDFIVPIMYRFGETATQAWRRFMPLLRAHFWRLALYGLFYFVLGIGGGMAVFLLLLVTCCTAGCLLIIPYVATVVLLPIQVFFRLYSLEYLSQFGDEYRMLS